VSEEIYSNTNLDIGTYCGPAGGDRKRFQITSWCDGERSHVALDRAQAAVVLVQLARHFGKEDDIVAPLLAGMAEA
jgi:hypothetical protein